MTKERQPEQVGHRIAALSTRLINIKDAAPGSEHHGRALRELIDVLASNREAINILARQQGQAVQNDDRI